MATVNVTVSWVADDKDEYSEFKDWWAKRLPDGMTMVNDDGNLTVTLSKVDNAWKVPTDPVPVPDEPEPPLVDD